VALDRGLLLKRANRGSAALEVLLLIPFILIIWALLFNMGYNADRKRKGQAAIRLGAYQYVTNLTTMDQQQSENSAEAIVNQHIFPGETNAADLYFSDSKQKPAGFNDDQGLLGKVSSRITMGVDVNRSAPYSAYTTNSDLQGGLIVSSNTWTFCEMKDNENGTAMKGLEGLNLVGDYGLWLFGGCGGDVFQFSCKDECPQ
jgi:hypothetical protein